MSEAPERNENKTAPAAPKKRTPPEMKTLPMLPLRGMVVFPYMIIHLDVGRERSLAALEKAMMEDHRILLVCQIDADKDDPRREDLYNYGTVAVINQILKLPGGTVRVLVEGEKRARISDYHRLENYDEVEAKVYTDPIYTSTDVEVATRSLIHRFEDWVKLSKRIPADTLVSVAIIDDAGRLADLIASHLNLKVHMRQDLLECINIRDRRMTSRTRSSSCAWSGTSTARSASRGTRPSATTTCASRSRSSARSSATRTTSSPTSPSTARSSPSAATPSACRRS